MIPSRPAALEKALSQLAPDGRLYIVDFWDQGRLPSWVASLLQGWLSLFDVAPCPELIRLIQALDAQGHLRCSVRPVARRYAYLATIAPPTDVDRMLAPHLGPTRVTEVAEKCLSSFS